MSQGRVRADIIRKIWRGADPLASFPKDLFVVDTQGWNSTHTYLTDEIETNRPSVIVEIGVWKGGSTITMAKKLQELQLDAVVIAVDTWLGSWEHWFQNNWFEWLCVDHGRPQLYSKFMANVLAAGVQDYVVPLPIDSINASIILERFNIKPDLVHIDGGHDYHSVSSDLKHWWNGLAAGGTFIGDDYFLDGAWGGRQACDRRFPGGTSTLALPTAGRKMPSHKIGRGLKRQIQFISALADRLEDGERVTAEPQPDLRIEVMRVAQ